MNRSRNPAVTLSKADHAQVRRSIIDSPLRLDFIHTLEFIKNSNGVKLTLVRGTMGRKYVKALIDGFIEKPIGWPLPNQTDEWRFSRLMMIDAIMRSLNLVEEQGRNLLVTTKLADEFISLSPDDQFLNMFSAWWNIANWSVVSEYETIIPETREDDYFELIGFLREKSLAGNGADQDVSDSAPAMNMGEFSFGEIEALWSGLCTREEPDILPGGSENGQGAKISPKRDVIIGNSVRWLILEPLQWFGFISERVNQDVGCAVGEMDGCDGVLDECEKDSHFLDSPLANDFNLTMLGTFMLEVVFTVKSQARMEAELAKYGRSLESFYRNSMYGPIMPQQMRSEHDEEEESEDMSYLQGNYAS